MTAINNNTLRPISIKVKAQREGTVRSIDKVVLMPGLNSVRDEDWEMVKDVSYAQLLQDHNQITVAKSKGEASNQHDKIDKETATKIGGKV